MPAPLGKTPTKKMPEIHVFGTSDSPATRAALRFFRERRIVVHQADLRKRPIAAGELQRFVQRLGARALLDVDGRAYTETGLAHMRLDDAEIVARLGGRPSASVAARPPRERGDRRARRGDLDGLGQDLARDLNAVQPTASPAATMPTPISAQRGSSTMKLDPRRSPSPWPIQTAPTRTRIAAMIQRVRTDTSRVAS